MRQKGCRFCGGEITEARRARSEYICTHCKTKQNKEWRKCNPELAREARKRAYKRHRIDRIRIAVKWAKDNPERMRENNRRYRQTEKGKVTRANVDKLWRKRNPELVKKYKKKFSKTERGKASIAKESKKSQLKYPEKYNARQIITKALRTGQIIQQPCIICGAISQAHHEDYNKPLEVVWLCNDHHWERHRVLKEKRA